MARGESRLLAPGFTAELGLVASVSSDMKLDDQRRLAVESGWAIHAYVVGCEGIAADCARSRAARLASSADASRGTPDARLHAAIDYRFAGSAECESAAPRSCPGRSLEARCERRP